MCVDLFACAQSMRVDYWPGHVISVRRTQLWQHSRQPTAASALAATLDCWRTRLDLCGRLRQRPCSAAGRETATEASDAVTLWWCQTAVAALFYTRNRRPGRWLCCRKCRTLSGWWGNKKKEMIWRYVQSMLACWGNLCMYISLIQSGSTIQELEWTLARWFTMFIMF